MAAVSEQAANNLDYLMNKLAQVKPLASDDVQGFMRDSEMGQAFGRLDRRSQEKMLLSMLSGKHQELSDALLCAHAVCSGLDTEQLKKLLYHSTSTACCHIILYRVHGILLKVIYKVSRAVKSSAFNEVNNGAGCLDCAIADAISSYTCQGYYD
ncbi:hypothetical protein [Salmonella enterica]|uniref:hypothetical protein n=1 Tax=Salmonella enterica TaxID=28901 RepID=UPI0020CA9E2E|nr:hypothetical protein [Salmonella enterica]